MKWFVYLFSFYLLLLSGIPCNADDDCCANEIRKTTTSNKQTSGDSDHKPTNPCSPFFACGSCNVAIVPDNVIAFSNKLSLLVKQYFLYKEQSLLDFPPSIWQPPKFI